MPSVRTLRLVLGLALAALAVAGCGDSAAAVGGANTPTGVARAYLDAVKAGADAGQAFLETESTEKLTGSTNLSRYLAANKGATAAVVPVQWIPPQKTAAVNTTEACLIGQPPPYQVCIVTVEVKGGKPTSPIYFHVNLENRYTGKWQIINVDAVNGTPDNLLPSGNEAHGA